VLKSSLTSTEIRKAFISPIAPVRVPIGYRIRLVGVVLGLAFLQLSYLLLIALVGYLTWLYILAALRSGVTPNAITLAFYIGPPVVSHTASESDRAVRPLLRKPKWLGRSAPQLFA
jgi:hypothetical protein